VLVEGVRATFASPATDLAGWALDERGARRDSVPMQENTIHLGPSTTRSGMKSPRNSCPFLLHPKRLLPCGVITATDRASYA
jgi:hypothetical protein